MAATKSGSFSRFFYRLNPDKTIDAICGVCFLTAATAETEDERHALESHHHCERVIGDPDRRTLAELSFIESAKAEVYRGNRTTLR
jgi:hypothetical protein